MKTLMAATLFLSTVVLAAPLRAAPLQTSGRRLLDSCGKPLVVRGVEQILGQELPPGNDWVRLVENIADSGANAVRILPGVGTLSVADVDEVLTSIGRRQMVAYIGPLSDDGSWLGRSDVRSMLAKHESYILLDAYGEPQYDDRERFRREAVEAIARVRAWGYRVPLTVTGNQFGRDLPSVLELGAEIVAADPLHNIILGWQAYWGTGGYYQGHYGLNLTQAMAAIAAAPFPIQIGLDYVTDPPSQTADFGALMNLAEADGVGWLWWDWYNPYGSDNNLSRDGGPDALTSVGRSVVDTHAASIAKTARLACRAGSAPGATPVPPPVVPSVPAPTNPASPPPISAAIAIDAGGDGADGFVADQSVSGGKLAPRSTKRIDRSRVPAPVPPEVVYQTERWGAMTYRVGGLEPFSAHSVELHFAEVRFSAVGQRKFNVTINDTRVLSDYDIVARAGGPSIAIREPFSTTANFAGEVVIRFGVGSVDEPKVDGIVIR
jgi:hypothetical protein